jgi:hypothetical protein
MDDTLNPFAVPASDRAPVADDAPPFYTVGPWKVAVLMVLTAGIYRLYWFYKQFRARADNGEDSIPLARALLHIFFVHRLFGDIGGWKAEDEPDSMFERSQSNAGIATLYVASLVLDRVLGRYEGDNPWLYLLGPVTLALETGVLVTIQGQIQAHLVHRGVPANREATPAFLGITGLLATVWLAGFAYICLLILGA